MGLVAELLFGSVDFVDQCGELMVGMLGWRTKDPVGQEILVLGLAQMVAGHFGGGPGLVV